MWLIRWILLAIVILAILTFSIQNQDHMVTVKLLKWQTPDLPLYITLFAAFVIGMFVFLLIAAPAQISTLFNLRKERKIQKKTGKEVDELKDQLENTKLDLKEAQKRKLALEDELEKVKAELEDAKKWVAKPPEDEE